MRKVRILNNISYQIITKALIYLLVHSFVLILMVLARPLIHILMTDNFRITSIYTYIACYSRLKIFEKNQNFHIFTNTFNVQEIKNIFFLKKKNS